MGWELEGLDEFRAAIERKRAAVSLETRRAVAEGAATVERGAKVAASGRPGPNVITGTLRRGIRASEVTPWGRAGWQGHVGPTNVYGRRVELGFLGRDSVGRVYGPPRNPAMYPYFTPTWAAFTPRWSGMLAAHWARALEA
jgi:hypothetical protein